MIPYLLMVVALLGAAGLAVAFAINVLI